MKSKNINKTILYIVDVILFIIGLLCDRLTKYYAINHLKDHPSISVISGYLELRYLENTGAAFGLLKNQKSFFVLVAVAVFLASLYVIIRTPAKRKYNISHITLVLIVTGAMGNMIDRLLYDYVVDFIYVSAINFPIFNVADIFVTIATIILVILLLFYYKEDDLNFLKFLEKKLRDIDN